ncbi:MAG: hypothetical protein P8Y53_01915 [Pseudolabrys sp.]
MQRALQLRQRLNLAERDRQLSLQLLEDLAVGILIVDARGGLMFANSVAEQVLKTQGWVTASGGRLRPIDSRYAARLHRALHEAADTRLDRGSGAGDMIILHARSGEPLTLYVAPFRLP